LRAIDLVLSNSRGVIIAGYGMGNLPTNNVLLMNMIEKAVKDGVIIVIKTQCYKGSVEDVYATGRMLTKMGCILGMDMTVECIFAKLSYLFGKVSSILRNTNFQGFSNEKIKKMMMKSLRGELTDTQNKEKFSLANNKMVMAIAKSLKVQDTEGMKMINDVITPVLVNSLVSTVRNFRLTFIVKFANTIVIN
jgi:hypothetical protein